MSDVIVRLGRVRLGARVALALGIGASLAANVAAAESTIAGRVIAAWPPVALLVTVELLSRVPVSGRLSALRVAAAAAIAGIAAWVSYWHMVDVALSAGESVSSAHLLPFSVDGLVIVASVSLLEITARLQTLTSATEAAKAAERATKAPKPKAKAKRSPATSNGDRIRRLAVQHPDWTQAQIADRAGVTVRTVRRHLNTTPGPDNLVILHRPDDTTQPGGQLSAVGVESGVNGSEVKS